MKINKWSIRYAIMSLVDTLWMPIPNYSLIYLMLIWCLKFVKPVQWHIKTTIRNFISIGSDFGFKIFVYFVNYICDVYVILKVQVFSVCDVPILIR